MNILVTVGEGKTGINPWCSVGIGNIGLNLYIYKCRNRGECVCVLQIGFSASKH